MINPFLEATINVIETFTTIKPEHGKPYLKKDRKAVGDVSGVIGMTGHSKGVVVLSFSTQAICKVVSAMGLGEFGEVTPDVSDAVGELTNMISGDARRRLAGIGFTFEAGLPTVISGKGHQVESVGSHPVIAIPFKMEGHDFVVEASFES